MGLSFDSVDGGRPGHGPDCPRPTGTTSLSSLTINDGRGRVHPFFVMDVRVLWITCAEARKRTHLVIGS